MPCWVRPLVHLALYSASGSKRCYFRMIHEPGCFLQLFPSYVSSTHSCRIGAVRGDIPACSLYCLSVEKLLTTSFLSTYTTPHEKFQKLTIDSVFKNKQPPQQKPMKKTHKPNKTSKWVDVGEFPSVCCKLGKDFFKFFPLFPLFPVHLICFPLPVWTSFQVFLIVDLFAEIVSFTFLLS